MAKTSFLMKGICIILMLVLTAGIAAANQNNTIFSIKVNDLKYALPEKKHNAGEVIGTVLGALAGEATNADNSHLAPAVSAMVKTAFSEVRRMAPVGNIADAQFVLTGEITSIVTHTSSRTIEHKDSKGKTYKELVNNYEASIAVTLTLTEPATDQQWVNSFAANTEWYEMPTGEAQAFEIAVNRLKKDVAKAYNTMFPLVANIIEAGATKKDKQKDVYIDLGEANGIFKGLHFEVFEVFELTSIAGHETRRKLGKLKVEETLGADISRCKVEKGAKEIKEAIDSGKPLLVASID